MVDFIDREELFNILQKYYDIYPTHTDEFDVLCRVGDDIRNLPKADTERHAFWIVQYDCGEPCGAICSNCGSEIPYDRDGLFDTEESIFCSHCGAKMGGAEVEAKIDERNAVDKELMKSKIKTAMEDLLQRNCICDYVFVQNKQKIHQKNIYALDAYMLAYDMATNGNVECYMAPNGEKAVKPVFTVIDGVITLSGLTIQ